ncbi:unnamed protein product [Ambrosiozyma monospora]|uniref:Unnamed protein product n=1 Tax=Ambrosiozyma monospora TaxID=43982 RepID=A0ACB5SYE9_AMBMO|nr:unnamed protein product [Ambrosiozyma monospora]
MQTVDPSTTSPHSHAKSKTVGIHITTDISSHSSASKEESVSSRKIIKKFTLDKPLSPNVEMNQLSVPVNAYVYHNRVVLADDEDEVIDEFNIKQDGKACLVNQNDLVAIVGDAEIVIENGGGDVFKKYTVQTV